MNTLDTQPAFSLPADPGFTAPPDRAPAHQMLESTYRPHEKEREYYREIFRHFPEERRARVHQCGVYALHIRTKTSSGDFDSVNPISCGDRAACIACAARYVTAQIAEQERLFKSLVGHLSAGITTLFVTLRLPRWAAAGAHAGCEAAETRGKMCRPSSCRTCAAARESQENAVTTETYIRRTVVETLRRTNAGIGGVYHTNVVWHAGAPALNVSVVVPQIRIGADGAHRLPTIDTASVVAALEAIAASEGGTVLETNKNEGIQITPALVGVKTVPALRSILAYMHAPMLTTLRNTAALESDVRTVARLHAMGTASESGRIRRLTRTQWFGALSARNKTATLATLGVQVSTTKPIAIREFLDTYLILHKDSEFYTMQSTRNAEVRLFHVGMVKASAYVLPHGAPADGGPAREHYGFIGHTDAAHAQALREARLNGGDFTPFVAPKSRKAMQRETLDRQWKVWSSETAWGAAIQGELAERTWSRP